jgi:hypothetical protein
VGAKVIVRPKTPDTPIECDSLSRHDAPLSYSYVPSTAHHRLVANARRPQPAKIPKALRSDRVCSTRALAPVRGHARFARRTPARRGNATSLASHPRGSLSPVDEEEGADADYASFVSS